MFAPVVICDLSRTDSPWVRRRTYEADSNKLPIARQRWIGQQHEEQSKGEENNGPRDKSGLPRSRPHWFHITVNGVVGRSISRSASRSAATKITGVPHSTYLLSINRTLGSASIACVIDASCALWIMHCWCISRATWSNILTRVIILEGTIWREK